MDNNRSDEKGHISVGDNGDDGDKTPLKEKMKPKSATLPASQPASVYGMQLDAVTKPDAEVAGREVAGRGEQDHPIQMPSVEKMAGLSIVTPMYNEKLGAREFVMELHTMLDKIPEISKEIIVVDDGSSDGTKQVLMDLKKALDQDHRGRLRVVCHENNAGQSRAIRTGVIAARYNVIAMIDGDGQNDPADIPAAYAMLRKDFNEQDEKPALKQNLPLDRLKDNTGEKLVMVAGERQKRQDSGAKKFGSRFANKVRQGLLKDGAADSGCGMKVFYRDAFMRLPYFDHIHRYLPFMMQREGFKVAFMPVGHRPRVHGQSKYTNWGRLVVAFRDLFGVLWLKARSRSPHNISEL